MTSTEQAAERRRRWSSAEMATQEGPDSPHQENVAPHLRRASSSGSKSLLKPLGLVQLVAIIFFEVSGGPFGSEDAVRAGGPLLALVGFLVLPLIWSVPEALITAELATTFPENSGYVAWVTAAFGPFWGFQEGFWSWVRCEKGEGLH